MKISILTLFPEMIRPFLDESILKRAQHKEKIEFELVNFRDFATDKHKSVDEPSYGGGTGMVLMVEPIVKALEQLKVTAGSTGTRILLTSAKGSAYTQKKAQELSKLQHVVIIAGHYEGFDERVLDYIDEEVSIGDFVMTGGEAAAVAITDSIVRLLPGVLEKSDATEEESFFHVPLEELIQAVGSHEKLNQLKEQGNVTVQLLEYPHYTRPETFREKSVPAVLMSGNHKNIRQWRLQEAFKITLQKRPDLLDKQAPE